MDWDNDPDSAELLMRDFDESVMETDNFMKLDHSQIPFFNCIPNESFEQCQSKINCLKIKNCEFDADVFGYDFPSFGTNEQDLEIVENLLIQNLLCESIMSEFSGADQIKEQISKCFIYLFKASQNDGLLKAQCIDILKSVDIALGPLNTKEANIQYNLQVKLLLSLIDETDTKLLDNIFSLIHSEFSSSFNENDIRDMSAKTPFSCTCLKNILLYKMETMSSKMFWTYVLSLFSDTSPQGQYPWSLFWWFIYHFCDDLKSFSECLSAIEIHFKTLKEKSSGHIRSSIMSLLKFSEKSALSIDILSGIWDFFRDRINENFDEIPRGTLEGFACLPKNFNDYFKKSQLCQFKKNLLQMFISLVGLHLSNCTKPEKEVQRFMPRMRRKLQIVMLTDIGIFNFTTVFMGLFKETREPLFIQGFLDVLKDGMISYFQILIITFSKVLFCTFLLNSIRRI